MRESGDRRVSLAVGGEQERGWGKMSWSQSNCAVHCREQGAAVTTTPPVKNRNKSKRDKSGPSHSKSTTGKGTKVPYVRVEGENQKKRGGGRGLHGRRGEGSKGKKEQTSKQSKKAQRAD